MDHPGQPGLHRGGPGASGGAAAADQSRAQGLVAAAAGARRHLAQHPDQRSGLAVAARLAGTATAWCGAGAVVRAQQSAQVSAGWHLASGGTGAAVATGHRCRAGSGGGDSRSTADRGGRLAADAGRGMAARSAAAGADPVPGAAAAAPAGARSAAAGTHQGCAVAGRGQRRSAGGWQWSRRGPLAPSGRPGGVRADSFRWICLLPGGL